MPTTELTGRTILVTRPVHQAESLCRLIEAAGGTPLRLPALEIHDNTDTTECRERLGHTGDYQIIIFISPNAVNFGLDAIEQHGGLSESALLATVGRGSARAVEERLGRMPDLLPETSYDSEALLQLDALQQVSGKRILIVRGVGGREQLAETLRERGATVAYAEVYRRLSPRAPEESGWLEQIDIITATSGEIIKNLVSMTPPQLRDKLYDIPMVVVSQRCAEIARELGFRQPLRVSAMASDEAIVEKLIEWTEG
ncbi:MAG: uroporphyrinogen-III synthase [Chromatiales bacterium]|nr:uroporphyrinogen-III synthase [Chromatiales bacterium]